MYQNEIDKSRTLYDILQDAAKAWRYHRELRERGEIEEARRLERSHISRNIEDLRRCQQGGAVVLGNGGGWYAVTGRWTSVHGHYVDLEAIPRLAFRLGIPVIDYREVPVENVGKLINFPMIAYGDTADQPPWGWLSKAPVDYVAWRCVQVGGSVYNVDWSRWAEYQAAQQEKEEAAKRRLLPAAKGGPKLHRTTFTALATRPGPSFTWVSEEVADWPGYETEEAPGLVVARMAQLHKRGPIETWEPGKEGWFVFHKASGHLVCPTSGLPTRKQAIAYAIVLTSELAGVLDFRKSAAVLQRSAPEATWQRTAYGRARKKAIEAAGLT